MRESNALLACPTLMMGTQSIVRNGFKIITSEIEKRIMFKSVAALKMMPASKDLVNLMK